VTGLEANGARFALGEKIRHASPMPISAAETIAFEVLIAWKRKGAYASDVLHAELGASVNGRMRRWHRMTLGVLRWRRLLDFLIERQ